MGNVTIFTLWHFADAFHYTLSHRCALNWVLIHTDNAVLGSSAGVARSSMLEY